MICMHSMHSIHIYCDSCDCHFDFIKINNALHLCINLMCIVVMEEQLEAITGK